MKNPRGLGSFQNAHITFLIGSVLGAGLRPFLRFVLLRFVLANGYMPVPSARLFAVIAVAPWLISIYAVAVLSGSKTWYLWTIGDKQQSLDRFRRYFAILLLGAGLAGLVSSVFHLFTSGSSSALQMASPALWLLALLVSLFAPKGGILMQK